MQKAAKMHPCEQKLFTPPRKKRRRPHEGPKKSGNPKVHRPNWQGEAQKPKKAAEIGTGQK